MFPTETGGTQSHAVWKEPGYNELTGVSQDSVCLKKANLML